MTNDLDALKYSLDCSLFITDILGLKCEKFHKEWIELFENNKYISLLAPRSHGKCERKGTLITLDNGTHKKIEDCKIGDRVLSKLPNNKIVSSTISDILDNGIKDIYRITLQSGKTVDITDNHPFFTGEWKSLRDGLQIGDRVAIPRQLHRYTETIYYTNNEIKILSYLIAEGNIGTSGSYIGFYSTSKEMFNDLNEALKDYGAKLKSNSDKYNYHIFSDCRGKKSSIRKFLENNNLWGKYAYNKELPDILFSAPKQQIKLFLKCLWKGDGNISKNLRDNVDISYSTSSHKLALQIQELLEHIGIPSNIYLHKTKCLPNYQIVIIGGKTNRLKFITNILNQKNYDVTSILNKTNEHSNIDTVPRDLVLKYLNITAWNLRIKYGIRIDNKYDISFNKLKRLIEIEPDNQKLKYLYDNDIRWDKIKSIEYIGKDRTYGLEIRNYHNHITNGIITHNTHLVGAYLTWRIVKNPNIRILTITINQDKANEMMTLVQRALEGNSDLINIYGQQKGYADWSRSALRVLRAGKGGRANKEPTLSVYGVTAGMVGGHYDIIVLDDITDRNNSRTEHRRKDLVNWYNSTITPMLEPEGQIISIGTKWHEVDIHSYFQSLPNYASRIYKAILNEEEKKVLWSEQWSYEELLNRKAGMGSIDFEMQYQNEIVSTEDSPIKREWIETSIENYKKLPDKFESFMGVDLASKGEESDFFTITIVGINSGKIFVLDGIRTKASLFRQFELIKSFDNKWTPAKIGIEQAAQQKMIVDQLIESTTLPIIPIKSSIVNDRMSRVQRLSVLFETGRIYLNPNLSDWINELTYFPRGSNDDTIDSLSFAIQASQGDEDKQVDWNAIKDMVSISKKPVGHTPNVKDRYKITKI